MAQVCSVYSQILQFFPRGQFHRAVKQHQAEFSAKGFSAGGSGSSDSFRRLLRGRSAFRFRLPELLADC